MLGVSVKVWVAVGDNVTVVVINPGVAEGPKGVSTSGVLVKVAVAEGSGVGVAGPGASPNAIRPMQ
jgi:hypothetical protein